MKELIVHERNGELITELRANGYLIADAQSFLDLMMEASSLDSHSIIVNEDSLPQGFFDLKTGIAGEIVQKAANYSFRLIITGDFTRYQSHSLQCFILESNKGKSLNFHADTNSALLAY
jgi:hypothetical protein